MAESNDPVQAPQDREKALSAAYLRMTGLSQSAAAKGAGIGERTLARYELCSWWPGLQSEAADRWLHGLKMDNRASLQRLVKAGEPTTVRFVAERIDPEYFGPPRLRHEHSGPDGGPIETSVVDARQRFEKRLDAVGGRLAEHEPSRTGSSG